VQETAHTLSQLAQEQTGTEAQTQQAQQAQQHTAADAEPSGHVAQLDCMEDAQLDCMEDAQHAYVTAQHAYVTAQHACSHSQHESQGFAVPQPTLQTLVTSEWWQKQCFPTR